MVDERLATSGVRANGMRPRTWWRGLTCAALTGAFIIGGLVGAQSPASADPDAVAKAKASLETIQAQSAKIESDYTDAQAALDKAQKSLSRAERDLTSQKAKVASMRAALGRVALGDYQSGGTVSTATQLVTSGDAGQFLTKLSMVQNVTSRTNEQFQSFQAEQATLQTLESTAAADRATIQAKRDQQAKLLKDADAKEKQAKAVLDKLTAQEKARLAAEQAAQAQALAAQAAARSQATTTVSRDQSRTTDTTTTTTSSPSTTSRSTSTSSSSTSSSRTTVSTSSSGRAATAIAYAMAQVGKAYVYGGTGPNGFDCSGLMLRAWGAAGVSLPRTSGEQYGAGTPVSVSQLQPGDLVFYYSGISHVGMYIGNGMIVHAANPRSGVTTAPLMSMPYQGARRVG